MFNVWKKLKEYSRFKVRKTIFPDYNQKVLENAVGGCIDGVYDYCFMYSLLVPYSQEPDITWDDIAVALKNVSDDAFDKVDGYVKSIRRSTIQIGEGLGNNKQVSLIKDYYNDSILIDDILHTEKYVDLFLLLGYGHDKIAHWTYCSTNGTEINPYPNWKARGRKILKYKLMRYF